jgi:hypothetical protein
MLGLFLFIQESTTIALKKVDRARKKSMMSGSDLRLEIR